LEKEAPMLPVCRWEMTTCDATVFLCCVVACGLWQSVLGTRYSVLVAFKTGETTQDILLGVRI